MISTPRNLNVGSHPHVDPSDQLKSAHFLLAMSLLPMLLWALFLANAIYFARRGNFGLTDFVVTGMLGLVAYIASAILGSLGMAAVSRDMRARPGQRSPWTLVLMSLTGAVLVLPWLAFVALLIAGSP